MSVRIDQLGAGTELNINSGQVILSESGLTIPAAAALTFLGRTKFVSSGDGAGAFTTNAGTNRVSWDTSGNVTLAGTTGHSLSAPLSYPTGSQTFLKWGSSGNQQLKTDGTQLLVYNGGIAANTASLNRSSHIVLRNDAAFAWTSATAADAGTIDLYLYRDAANVLALRNSTNAQAFRWSHTHTDSSNYQRGALRTGSTYVEVAAETAGTGADDIDVLLTPAGTGKVSFGSHSAIAAETVTGYITIKDNGGTTRKIAVVS